MIHTSVSARFASLAILAGFSLLATTPAHAQCVNGAPDGIYVPPGEACDDGNTMAGDGCSPMCAIEGGWVCAPPISLRVEGLERFNYPGGNSNWTFSDNGFTGTQTVNSTTPTIATFGADASAATWGLELTVTSAGDDDFMGFVFGFDSSDLSSPTAEYLLLDWKGGAQACATAGMRLSRVTGVPNFGGSGTETTSDFWCHTTSASGGVATIATAMGGFGTAGWVVGTTYRFNITYTTAHIRVTVTAGATTTTVFDLSAPPGMPFPAGEIGMYGYSQPNTRYRVVSPRGPSSCNRIPTVADHTHTVVHAAGPRCFDVTTGATDPDGDTIVGGSVRNQSGVVVGVTVTDPTSGAPSGRICLDPLVDVGTQTYNLTYRACDDGTPAGCDTGNLSVTFVDCLMNSDCGGLTPFCNASRVCVGCTTAAHCDDSNPCTTDACGLLGVCTRTPVPAGTSCGAGVCNATSTCVECVSNADCTDAALPFCDVTAAVCVECLLDAQCDDANVCTTDSCTARTCSSTPGPVGTPCATGACSTAGMCIDVAVAIVAPAEGSVGADTTPTITGTATPNAVIVVTVDGTPVGTTTADALGGWAVTPAAPLSEGAHSVTATATVATNDASDTNAFEIDLSTVVAITEPSNGATIIDSTPDVVGTGEPGATIVVSIDGTEVGTTTVEADGTWRVALTTALENGDHTATAAATDTFGHTDTATSTFTVDARTSVAITAPANGSHINDPMPTITGTAAAGASVEVTVDGTVLGTVTADASGMWSIPTTSALSDGEHVVTAEATDAFGNRAEDTSTFTVDTETTVEITVATAETIEGTGEPGASVEITIDGAVVGTVVVDSEGTWVLGLDPALGPGTHEVTATSTDEAGNTATDTAVVTVDTPDGGVDAGGPDAGGGDVGVPDASMIDGGLDGGVVPTGGGLAGGALCSARPGQPSGGSWILALALAALVVIRRRTR